MSEARRQKIEKLLPDYGAMALKRRIKTVSLYSEGGSVTAAYYPALGFAEFSLAMAGYGVTLQVPCKKEEVSRILEKMSRGFHAEVRPNAAKAFTTANGAERVIPLEIVDLDKFMASTKAV